MVVVVVVVQEYARPGARVRHRPDRYFSSSSFASPFLYCCRAGGFFGLPGVSRQRPRRRSMTTVSLGTAQAVQGLRRPARFSSASP